jgi:alpha-amylase
VTATKNVGGKTWIYKTYRVTAKNNPINIVISAGTGSPQTVDVENISTDKYFVISASKDSGNKNFVEDVTETYTTGIGNITVNTAGISRIYNLNGQYVGTDCDALAPGVYIQNGKKYVVR